METIQRREQPELPPELSDIPRDVLREVPQSICEKYHVLPISRDQDSLELAVVDKNDLDLRGTLELVLSDKKLEYSEFSKPAIAAALERYYPAESPNLAEATF